MYASSASGRNALHCRITGALLMERFLWIAIPLSVRRGFDCKPVNYELKVDDEVREQ